MGGMQVNFIVPPLREQSAVDRLAALGEGEAAWNLVRARVMLLVNGTPSPIAVNPVGYSDGHSGLREDNWVRKLPLGKPLWIRFNPLEAGLAFGDNYGTLIEIEDDSR